MARGRSVVVGAGAPDELEEGVGAGAVQERHDVSLDGVGADAEVVGDVGVAGDALNREGEHLGLALGHTAMLAEPGDVGSRLGAAGPVGGFEASTQ